MEKTFNIAEQIKDMLLLLKEPLFVRDYILYYTTGVKNEKLNNGIENTLEPIESLLSDWDSELLKLLVRDIPNSKKSVIFLQLESDVISLSEKNDNISIEKVIKDTPIGPSITIAYTEGCNQYKKIISALINNYKDTFFKYRNSFTISHANTKSQNTKQEQEKVEIERRIGWYNNVKRKEGKIINFEDFFNEQIAANKIVLPNKKSNKNAIFKVLREIFDVVNWKESNGQTPKKEPNVKKTPQVLSHRLEWTETSEDFCILFGELIDVDKEKTVLFLNTSSGDATPIGRIFCKAFAIYKRVKGERIPIKESTLVSSLRKHSSKITPGKKTSEDSKNENNSANKSTRI